jgi:acyl-coenzyme A thioesterase PaaI-like protein
MTSKLGDAKGLAVYEMSVQGEVENDALVALAEEAIRGAAVTVTDAVTIGDLSAEYHGPVAGETLRAEALVMRKTGATMRVAADILAGGSRVASFEADALAAAS